MPSIHTTKEFLDLIHRRPVMFWGGGDHPFTSLVAFLQGVRVGLLFAQPNAGLQPDALVPDGFHKFVTERFGRRYPDGGKGWMTFITVHTSSEQEAFELFFKLREEYDKTHVA